MASSPQSVGIAEIWWKGAQLPNEKGATLKLPGNRANPVNAGRQTFFANEYMNGEAKATMPWRRGDSAAIYAPGDPGELQVRLDTGQAYTMAEAWITEQPMITGGEGGKVAVTWHFGNYVELISG